MTRNGALMSSTESYAAKRNEFIQDFADQLAHGVYQTTTTDQEVDDLTSGTKKTAKVMVILYDPKTGQFGITIIPPTITDIVYEPAVEKQIEAQREFTIQIQIAQAEARKADQAARTAESNGQAEAAKAKWAQEVIKAQKVTEAEQLKQVAETKAQQDLDVAETAAKRDLDVATFQAQQAEQYKTEQIKIGEGDAARKQAVFTADGALEQKLAAWTKSQEYWANAMSKYQGNLVPSIVGSGGDNKSNGAVDFMSIMGMKAAKDLALDLSLPNKAAAK